MPTRNTAKRPNNGQNRHIIQPQEAGKTAEIPLEPPAPSIGQDSREEVSAENFFLFGLTADQVVKRKAEGYHPADYYHGDTERMTAIDLINSGLFSHGDTELFRPLTGHLLHHDEFLLIADYRA